MALTPEEAQRLRQKYGLNNTTKDQTAEELVRQIRAEKEQTQQTLVDDVAQKSGIQKVAGGVKNFIGSIARETARPFARAAVTGLAALEAGSDLARGALRGDIEQGAVEAEDAINRTRQVPFVGETKPLLTGKETTGQMLKKTTGLGAEIASTFVGGGAVKNLGVNTVKGLMTQGFKQGAKGGLVAGTLGLGGRSASEGDSALDIVLEGALGGLAGVTIGGALGAGMPAVSAGLRKTLQPVEVKVSNTIRQAVDKGIKPYFATRQTPEQARRFYDLAEKAFVSIYKRKPTLFDEDTGTEIAKLPGTRAEMMEALGKAKQQVFTEYDDIARQAGGVGVQFNPQKALSELNRISDVSNKQYSPAVRKYATQLIDEIDELRGQTPLVIQERIKELNSSLVSFFSGRTDKTKAQIDASVARLLNEELDNEVLNALSNNAYRTLRNEYSSLKSIEKDLARQVSVELRKNNKGLLDFTDIFTGQDILVGAMSGNPAQLARGVAGRGIKEYLKYLNDPNRYIKKAFDTLDSPPADIKRYVDEAVDYLRSRGGLTIEDVTKKKGSSVAKSTTDDITQSIQKATLPYKGEKDLTTKILKDLEGKTTVSKQYILDATNRGELKQVERDLIRDIVSREGDTVNVADFAKKVKAELLPLKRMSIGKQADKADMGDGVRLKYESISLPDELRGSVKNYDENIYRSPIKTSAGQTHFGDVDTGDYFGHTRIEDMADNKTRRVIEVQSDLYQKGNLERSVKSAMADGTRKLQEIVNDSNSGIAKLQQYNDPTAHFRMLREEIKKAAQDGKTKLQFPTGETAMKIERLGDNTIWQFNGNEVLSRDNLSVGIEVRQGANIASPRWIITDVLGDGKFKAVPKSAYERAMPSAFDGKPMVQESMKESFDISGKVDTNNPIYRFYEKDVSKYLNKFDGKRVVDENGVSWIEVPIKKEYGKMPVEAFTIAPFLLPSREE